MADRLTSMARTSRREVRERKQFGGVSNAELVRHFEELNRNRPGDLLALVFDRALTAPRTGAGVE